ncbi:unnamed protein product [Sphagnum jensenii]|uniref:BHLH domain-containing protein n=1 Tax=Sphagnum jensenii TaxID=128206 RepID=A0ABP1AF25_9BRYO
MLAVQKAWGYKMSDGCRGRRGRRGGRADGQPSTNTTTASRENARGLGDTDGASLATALHEMEQDLRGEESNASLLQQQIVYDKYLSAVPFLQERKISSPAFHSTLIAASDTLESAVTTSSQPVQQQTVIDSLLLYTSPAAMEQQQVSGLLLPTTYTSSHNSLVPGISRSGSLDLDTGASLATVAFQCETQAAVIRNEAAVGAAVTEWKANVGGDATKVSHQLLAGVKRVRGGGGGGSADHNAQEFLEEVQQQFRKKQQRSETTTSARWKRPIDQAEHIARERQRRDNMTSRFSTLETLLPPGPKRDRSTIVDESIQYVKNLHHQISVLRQRRSDLKRTVESSSSCLTIGERTAGSTTTAIFSTPIQGNNPCSIDTTTTTPAEEMPVSKGQGQSGNDTAVAASMMPMLVKEDSYIPVKQQSNSNVAATRKNSRSCADKLDVFMDLPEQVVIEMVCQPHPHIQSQILQAVESLGLDVCQCSLNKVVLRVVYVIVAKPRVVMSNAVSYDDIMEALKSALGPNIIPDTKPGIEII